MDEINSPPAAAALMESTRCIGYSFESAISDILDNSISASAKNIWIYSTPSDDPFVTILDDGDGLTKEELIAAMRYGANPNEKREETDLGRFGLGLKMASLSQCRCLTVISKTESGVISCRWDLDRVIQTDQWTLQILSDSEVQDLPSVGDLHKLSHGTRVIWQNLDKLKERAVKVDELMSQTLLSCKKHLSMIFHRFMEPKNNPLNIYLNHDKLVPLDPFFTSSNLTRSLPEQSIIIQGQVVTVKPYVLPPESKMKPADLEKIGGLQRNLQGFWVYRNKRLIIPGTWFKLSRSKELSKLARVRVDIPNSLDSIWDIDVKKSSASVPVIFQHDFEKILEKVIETSEYKYKFRGRKVSDSNKHFIWDKYAHDGGYRYSVNKEHPVVKNCLDSVDKSMQGAILELIKYLEDSIPYNDIFNTMGEAKLSVPEITSEEIEALIENGRKLIDKGLKVDNLKTIEPFMNYQEVLDRLKNYESGE